MHGGQARVALGLLLVVGGTVWAAAGPQAVRELALWGVRVLPLVLAVTGIVAVVRVMAPTSSVTGPVLLIVVGAAGVGYQLGLFPAPGGSTVVPVVIVLLGVATVLGRGRRGEPEQPPVRRYTSVLLPRSVRERGTAPRSAAVRCLLGHLDIDLRDSTYPPNTYRVTVDVTIVGGSVTVTVPRGWAVWHRPFELAHGTRIHGVLATGPTAPPVPSDAERGRHVVVLTVRGVRGSVDVVAPYPGEEAPGSEAPAAPCG